MRHFLAFLPWTKGTWGDGTNKSREKKVKMMLIKHETEQFQCIV